MRKHVITYTLYYTRQTDSGPVEDSAPVTFTLDAAEMTLPEFSQAVQDRVGLHQALLFRSAMTVDDKDDLDTFIFRKETVGLE